MSLIYAPLFSGSSGNCIFVGDGESGVLVDAGVPGRRICEALDALSIDPGCLRAILVTHAHFDHVAGVGVVARKFGLPVYATEECMPQMLPKLGKLPKGRLCALMPGQDLYFGGLEVTPFETPHDASGSVGYLFEHDGARFALATDLGHRQKDWLKAVSGADAVLLESNYDPDMLETGPYSYELKRRIASAHGHLSNDDAAETAVELVRSGTRHIILGHLSKENNTPELARLTVEQALERAGILPGEDVRLDVAKRDGVTGAWSIER